MQENEVLCKKLAGYARIVICAAFVILFAVLSVLELLPKNRSGLQTKEAFRISSASLTPLDSQEKRYTCHLRGTLENPTDDTIRVEALQVTVEGDGGEQLLELLEFLKLPNEKEVVMPARTSREVNFSFEGTVDYDTVKSVSVTVSGTAERLPNRNGTPIVSGFLVFLLVGLAVCVLLLVDACKRFGYLRQELAARSKIL
ncbi:MAG: hypothetical protein IKJ35_09450 [Clostridia bacterium]|nr:hypothetical protein [Clostridia bacterium]